MDPAADPLRRWLDAAREGDDGAVERLVTESQPLVWRVCSSLGSRDDVEDLVQETYLRALRSIDGYRGDAPVRAWLVAIARHVCADHVRRRQRRRRLRDRLELFWDHGAHGPVDVVDDLITSLTAERREAFVLTQLAGLSYDEAAIAIGCPIGTVRSRVARARADLTVMLDAAEAR